MRLFLLLIGFLFCSATVQAWIPSSIRKIPGVDRIRNDFLALTRRVTARHILVTDKELAMALKHKIRQTCFRACLHEKRQRQRF